ncbi:MAG TPA: hypothetical protein VLB79_07895 [Solirubrobacterales bacterium]|nr:hypothetical protein [Solirubrobacterales bacterium]
MIGALALASIAIGLLASGCGGDSSGETTQPTVSIPAITSPIPATSGTAPAATTTTATSPKSGDGNGGSGPPKRANPNKPDSATNDVPPPPGSPQQAFEKQCEQNPQACG